MSCLSCLQLPFPDKKVNKTDSLKRVRSNITGQETRTKTMVRVIVTFLLTVIIEGLQWYIDKDVQWINLHLFQTPNLYYEVEFKIEFNQENCCPLLDLKAYPREEFTSESCYDPQQLLRETVWFKKSIAFLELGRTDDFVHCEMESTYHTGRYTCKVRVKGQNYEPKQKFIALGYLCEPQRRSLQNIFIKATILESSNSTTCEPIDGDSSTLPCATFYSHVSFPNEFGNYKQQDTNHIVELLKTLMKNVKFPCYQHLVYILCQAFFPQCPAGLEQNTTSLQSQGNTFHSNYLVTVCSEMYEEFVKSCTDSLQPVIGLLRCAYYKSKHESDLCVYKNVTCHTPTIPQNAKPLDSKEKYIASELVQFSCLDGYKLEGNSSLYCTHAGVWSDSGDCVQKAADSSIYWKIPLAIFILVIIIFSIIAGLCIKRKRSQRTTENIKTILKRKRPYDAFVSYYSDPPDKDYVRQILYPTLEIEAHPPFKLIFHERNFRADTLIYVNILNAIRDSDSAIIIMSQNYVNADWCREEFQECMEEAKKDPAYKLFVILLEPHESLENCTAYMMKYFRDRTYLERDDPKLFDKLTEYLRELQVPDEEVVQEHKV